MLGGSGESQNNILNVIFRYIYIPIYIYLFAHLFKNMQNGRAFQNLSPLISVTTLLKKGIMNGISGSNPITRYLLH